jgi:hypothetical protein
LDWGLHYGIKYIDIREFEYSFIDITYIHVDWNAMDVALDKIRFDMDTQQNTIGVIMKEKQKKILQSFQGFRSPIDEVSLYKGIDINYLKLFKKEFKGMFKYRPRGGRYHIQNNCRMRDAKTFAIYPRDIPNEERRYWVV